MPATKFIVASAPAARPDPRTTWVWLPVQKQARETPWRSWASRKGTKAADRATMPLLTASSRPAPAMSVQSGQRRIAGPRNMRVTSWETADSAVSAPISVAE